MVIGRKQIEEAAARVGGRIRCTPTIEIEAGAFGQAVPVTLKLELMQHTGSFKPRGAFNRMLASAIPAAGVIAASGGNHGAALAYAARELGHRAEIYVPETTPVLKRKRLEEYGAHVTTTGGSYSQALAASEQRALETDALRVHAYDQEEVVAGQGTLARELERQAPALQTVFIAVGGGGLIGGVAAWYAGRTRVIGVEPQSCPTLARALAAGHPVDVEVGGIAADALGARRIGDIAFALAQRYVERVLLVSDEAITAAQRLLWDRLRVLAEPGGATALAGLLSGQAAGDAGRVGVVVCGGNVDPARFLQD
jgi:threonine dehydratase